LDGSVFSHQAAAGERRNRSESEHNPNRYRHEPYPSAGPRNSLRHLVLSGLVWRYDEVKRLAVPLHRRIG
jgi:hypothetical protein